MVNGKVSQLTRAELTRLATTGTSGLRPESVIPETQAKRFVGRPVFAGGGREPTGVVSAGFRGGRVGQGQVMTARQQQARNAAVARSALRQRATTVVENVDAKVIALQNEAKGISSERSSLEELRATIQKRQVSLVQRDTPFTSKLVREFNDRVKNFNQSVGAFNSKQANLNREIITASFTANQAGIDTSRVQFVKDKFADIGTAQKADPTAPEVRVLPGERAQQRLREGGMFFAVDAGEGRTPLPEPFVDRGIPVVGPAARVVKETLIGAPGEFFGRTFLSGSIALFGERVVRGKQTPEELAELKRLRVPTAALTGTEEEFGKFGRASFEIGSLFLPGGAGLAATGLAAAGSEDFFEAALSLGVGAGVGGVVRAAPTLGRLAMVRAPAGGATKFLRASLGIGGKAAKVAIPVATGAFAVQAGQELVVSFGKPEEEFERELRGFTSELGAFIFGAGLGTRGAGRVLKPLEGKAGLISRIKFQKEHPRAGPKLKEKFELATKVDRLEIKPSKVNLSEAERVSTKTARITEKFLRNNPQVKLGGSASQNSQFPTGFKKTVPGDVDLYSPNEAKFAKDLFNQLKAAGRNVRLQKLGPTTYGIFETVGGKSQKAIEVHNIKQLLQNIGEVRPFFSRTGAQFVKDPTGISMLKLSIQARRKAVAGFLGGTTRAKDKVSFRELFEPVIETIPAKVSTVKSLTGGLRAFALEQGAQFNLGLFASSVGGFAPLVSDAKARRAPSFVSSVPSAVALRPSVSPAASAVALRKAAGDLFGLAPTPSQDLGKTEKQFRDLLSLAPSGVPVRQRQLPDFFGPSAVQVRRGRRQQLVPSDVFLRGKPDVPSATGFRKRLSSIVLDRSDVPVRGKRAAPFVPLSAVPVRRRKAVPFLPPSAPSAVPLRDVPSFTPFKPIARKPPLLPGFFPPFFERPRKKKKIVKGQGFDVLLKVRGKFRKQNPRPLHKSTALGLGAFLADETAAQTFKTRATKQKPTGPKIKKPNLRKFRKPIRKGVSQRGSPLFVERTAFLIDRPSEKKTITEAGLRALRSRFFGRKKKRKVKKKGRR